MIKFKTLTIRNFLSYGNVPTTIRLDQPGTTLILGTNLDSTEQGSESNGVGKTVIVNALTYVVLDKPVSNISKDNLVNNINKKNMEVTVDFEKDGKNYFIKRARKTKAGAAGNYVVLKENGKDITLDSVSRTNRLIEKIIGIPYELFVRIVVFSATNTPFLDLPVRSHYAANQTDIIEELFDLKTLSEKAVLLKEKVKTTEQKLDLLKTKTAQLKKEHERHNKQILSAEHRVINWQQQNDGEIATIKQKLNKIKDVDIDQQRNLHIEISHVDEELRGALDQQRITEDAIKKYQRDKKQNTKELKHLRDSKCPYCLQQYKDAESKIQECEDKVTTATKEIEPLEKEIERIDKTVQELSTKHKEIKGQITVHDLDELLDIKGKVEHYKKHLEELKELKNPFIEPLEELRAIKLDKIQMEKVNKLSSLIEHQKFLIKLLTKKDSFVRKTLLTKNIPFLNKRLAHYLSLIGLPHTVEFTHQMTASISQFGRPMDFGNLSNGQRARVNLALSFAFRDVLQTLHQKINVCMLDEVLDVGLDTVGVQMAAKMLKHKAREESLSLFIVSHRDEIDVNSFSRTINIEYSKGFSYLKEEVD